MTGRRSVVVCAVAALLWSPAVAHAVCPGTGCFAMDPAADRIQLRSSCAGQSNCCETSEALTKWIGTCRVANPPRLLVDVGPGAFGQIKCGWAFLPFPPNAPPAFTDVTFRGSGTEQTFFKVPAGCTSCAPIEVGQGCDDLEFLNLTVDGADTKYGVLWRVDAGDSTWTNVHVLGNELGWYEFTFAPSSFCNPAVNFPVHVWFDSKIETRGVNVGQGVSAYQANCGESRLFNTELLAAVSSSGVNLTEGVNALSIGADPQLGDLTRKGRVLLAGSVIRMIAPAWTGGTYDQIIAGVRVYPNGELAMNDGVINVTVSAANPSTIYDLKVDAASGSLPAGRAHTAGAGFIVTRTGTPDVGAASWRVAGTNATAESPFLWSAGTDLPRPRAGSAQTVQTLTGADLFVETDCGTTTNCTGGSQPHLLISNASCLSGWFNSTTKACRAP
jgi:hypothetical protein